MLRHAYNALRCVIRAGAPWRYLPTDFPPWENVDQQAQRWVAAGCFEAIAHDLRALLRMTEDRALLWPPSLRCGMTAMGVIVSVAMAGAHGYVRRRDLPELYRSRSGEPTAQRTVRMADTPPNSSRRAGRSDGTSHAPPSIRTLIS